MTEIVGKDQKERNNTDEEEVQLLNDEFEEEPTKRITIKMVDEIRNITIPVTGTA